MTPPWVRPLGIVAVAATLYGLNAKEFKAKRRELENQFSAAAEHGAPLPFARQQALQALTIEQLLHMIHTMLAAILAALLWQ